MAPERVRCRRAGMRSGVRRLSFVFGSLFVLGACGGGGGGGAPAAPLVALLAEPAAFAPGATVTLRPYFPGAAARIEPFVGPVESGRSYVVGPVGADVTFTLVVTTPAGDERRSLAVPLRYRERVQELPANPVARTRAGATQLADGSVLLVGGSSSSSLAWANSERLALVGGQLVGEPVGELALGRSDSTLVLQPNGSVLTFGGNTNSSQFADTTRVEEWTPAVRAWSIRGDLRCNRNRHTATRLADGRVLLAGGLAIGPLADRDAELWVPGVGAEAPANEMVVRRAAHTAHRMADGRVLLVGGYDLGTGAAVARCEWFDPATSTFAPGPLLTTARFYHAVVPLADGRLLAIGGEDEGIQLRASAELYDPATDTWTPTGSLQRARTDVRAVRLATGAVLVVGGVDGDGTATGAIEQWSPATGQWRPWAAALPGPRAGHAVFALPDGRVLVLGGDPSTGFPDGRQFVLD